ncbi:MAG: LysM domain-containing protein [Pseudomonadota bacterium]
MRKSILLLSLCLFFNLSLSGCSLFSSSDEEETETATVSQEESGLEDSDGEESGDDSFEDDDFDAEEMASDDSDEESSSEDEDSDSGDDFLADGTDEYPDDDYSGGKSTAGKEEGDEVDDNFASNDSLYVDEGGLPSDTMNTNQDDDLFGGDSEPVVDTPAFTDTTFDEAPVADVPKLIPVKKMKTATYQRAGANINRLYVVRPGDNMKKIAQKIYGDGSRSKDLYAYNSHFTGKSLRVGDKIYYESPSNKNDQTMMTYYEDINLEPQYYTSRDGDNIRKISKKLLGHPRSWMEVYATNEKVTSKDRLPAGLQLRYWPEGGSEMTMAKNSPPPPPPAMTDPEPEPIAEPEPMPEPEEVAMEEPEPMPEMEEPMEKPMAEPKEVAMNEPPKPMNDPMMKDNPPDMAPAKAKMEDLPPPPPAVGSTAPPPPKPIAPPPPPAPRAKFNKPKAPKKRMAPVDTGGGLAGMGDDSMIMGALGGLLILAAIIMLIFIRRSRAKRVNFSQTQI